jgi:Zn-dependent protease with chaperone function
MHWLIGLLVAAMMLLLPVLYVGLIGLVLLFLAWHATTNADIVTHYGPWLRLMLYIGPLFIGFTLVLFMIKPLLTRPSRRRQSRALPLHKEPLLHAFVVRVARAVRAPEPKYIKVDCQVNASASLGDGGSALLGRNLVLTIGLPLVAGLNMQQLAGVLAHELGHFAQGGGMRLCYIIRSVNAWFSRAVYERDGWDEMLVAGGEDAGPLEAVFYAARLCVALTRGLLWVFMMLGKVISYLLERQMEYDADQYAARLIGSAAYEEAARQIMTLVFGNQAVDGMLAEAMHKGLLPDDLPGRIVAESEGFSEEQLRQLEKELMATRTTLFDTHPAFPDRMAAVRRVKLPGIFCLDRPATKLFLDYPKLARVVTQDFYRQRLGKARPRNTKPVASMQDRQANP